MSIVFSYSIWWLLPGFILAAGISMFLYYRDKKLKDLRKIRKQLLMVLRFLFVFSLIFLLLGPEIRFRKSEEQKPLFVILQDNSASVVMNRDSNYYQKEYPREIENLKQKLSSKFDVRYIQFGDSIRENDSINFLDGLTSMSKLSDALEIRYSGQQVGGVLFASDGLYNQGRNPFNSFSALSYPVYSLALGDTLQQKDALVSDLKYNQLVFLNNHFPVRIFYEAWDMEGETLQLSIKKNGEILSKEEININSSVEMNHVDIELNADTKGLQIYSVEISAVDGEVVLENNSRMVLVNVIDNQQKILILGRAPHPDIAAIKRALDENQNFSAEVKMARELPIDFTGVDLLILHELPSQQFPVSEAFKLVEKRQIPIMMIQGPKTDYQAFNQLGMQMQFEVKSTSFDNAQPSLSSKFERFDLPSGFASLVDNLPPLNVPFANISFSDEHDIMLLQKISGVKTDKPLIVFVRNDERKMAYINGTGMWHWRISDYRINGNHDSFDNLMNTMVQYLVTKKTGKQFIVKTEQMFTDNDAVEFSAELYNEAWELTNESEVKLIVTDSSNNSLEYLFNRGLNAYRLNIGSLPAGSYNWTASCDLLDETFVDKGAFVVREVFVEGLKTRANHQLMAMIAENTDGKLFYPKDIPNIADTIMSLDISKPRLVESENRKNLIHIKWIFFILLGWISTEWFLRKFWGSY